MREIYIYRRGDKDGKKNTGRRKSLPTKFKWESNKLAFSCPTGCQ